MTSMTPAHDLARMPRPPWLTPAVWPFDTYGLRTPRGTIAITDVGTGPTLLLVHVGLWSFIWRDLIQELSRDFRCVCFDAPGSGRSSRPSASVSLDGAATAVAAVIEQLRLDDFTLVIHDLGGLAGIVGAARSGAAVRRVAAINAFAWRPRGRVLRAMLRMIGSAPVRELDAALRLVPRITATSFGIGRHMDGQGRDAFLAGMRRGSVRAFHRYLADALRADAIHAEADAALATRFADLPLLTIFGKRNDPFGFQPEWKRRFPRAVQRVIHGGNHFPMCDDPRFVAESLRAQIKGDGGV